MRRVMALICGAVYLTFGLLAGAAHLHESADHHAESRGLHLDHAHLGDSAGHEREEHHSHDSHHPHHGDEDQVRGHVIHHQGDVFYLGTAATSSLESDHRQSPAIVSFGAADESPSVISIRDESVSGPPRDPPQTSRIRPRGPPA